MLPIVILDLPLGSEAQQMCIRVKIQRCVSEKDSSDCVDGSAKVFIPRPRPRALSE